MKTFWTILITAVVAACISVGCVFIIQGNMNKKSNKDENNTSYTMEYLESKYDVGDDVVYRFRVYSDVEFLAITYKLTNGEEQEIINVKTGNTEDLSNVEDGLGKYYCDTKVQIILTQELADGYYTLAFFGYDAEDNRYEITEAPYTFKLCAVEAPAAE